MEKITVSAVVSAPVGKVWSRWTNPSDILQWNHAADDWHCPAATNELRIGGQLRATMAACDGSASFDFVGTYTEIIPEKRLRYSMDNGRAVEVTFEEREGSTVVIETFEAEQVHSIELQRAGWQAILDNFKKHCESK